MAQTETNINLGNYVEEKALGQVKILKPVKNSANYVYMKANYVLSMVNGVPTATEQPPTISNMNRQSIADIEAQLALREAEILKVRQQLAAIKADMDALDLV